MNTRPLTIWYDWCLQSAWSPKFLITLKFYLVPNPSLRSFHFWYMHNWAGAESFLHNRYVYNRDGAESFLHNWFVHNWIGAESFLHNRFVHNRAGAEPVAFPIDTVLGYSRAQSVCVRSVVLNQHRAKSCIAWSMPSPLCSHRNHNFFSMLPLCLREFTYIRGENNHERPSSASLTGRPRLITIYLREHVSWTGTGNRIYDRALSGVQEYQQRSLHGWFAFNFVSFK